jgi:hypothetical protein
MGSTTVLGYHEGLVDGIVMSDGKPTDDDLSNAFPEKATVGEVVSFLDEFFSHPENSQLQVTQAIRVFAVTRSGAVSTSDEDKILRVLRKEAAEASKDK